MTVTFETTPMNRLRWTATFCLLLLVMLFWGAVSRSDQMPAIIGTLSQATSVLVVTASAMYIFRALISYAKTHPAPFPRYWMVAGGTVTLVLAWIVVVLNFIYPALPVRNLLEHAPFEITDAVRSQAYALSNLLNFVQFMFIISLKERENRQSGV
jgi:hypothetical protein